MSTTKQQEANKSVSGTAIVVAAFAFALVLTVVMWLYWKLHLAPFLPLQQAIAEEFPDSAPLVQGGQRKMHKNMPRILRITLRVDFDPIQNDGITFRIANQVAKLAAEYHDWRRYDRLEVHLFQLVPERKAKERKIEFDTVEFLEGIER